METMTLTRAQHLYKIASPGQRVYRLRQLQALVHAALVAKSATTGAMQKGLQKDLQKGKP
jgi:hypothetical protein